MYDWTKADANALVASAATNARSQGLELKRDDRKGLDSRDLDRSATGSTPLTSSPALQQKSPERIADDRLPRGQEDLDSLEGLEGGAFDAEFKEKQLDALQQIETDYKDYAVKGDVTALKAIAARELPKVQRRLVQLGQF